LTGVGFGKDGRGQNTLTVRKGQFGEKPVNKEGRRRQFTGGWSGKKVWKHVD